MKRFHHDQWVGLLAVLMAVGWVATRPDVSIHSSDRPEHRSRDEHATPSQAGSFGDKFRQIADGKDSVRRDDALSALAERWINAHPEDALEFARQLPVGEIRETFYRQLLQAWGRGDAEPALSWADGMEIDKDRQRARAMICSALAEEFPRRALDLAIRHGADEETNDSLIENLAMQWADREPASTFDWVIQQPAGEWRDRLMARVAFVLSRTDPATAASAVAHEISEGPLQDEAAISILHQWARIDRVNASAWIREFPPSPLRDRAFAELEASTPRDTRLPASEESN